MELGDDDGSTEGIDEGDELDFKLLGVADGATDSTIDGVDDGSVVDIELATADGIVEDVDEGKTLGDQKECWMALLMVLWMVSMKSCLMV